MVELRPHEAEDREPEDEPHEEHETAMGPAVGRRTVPVGASSTVLSSGVAPKNSACLPAARVPDPLRAPKGPVPASVVKDGSAVSSTRAWESAEVQ